MGPYQRTPKQVAIELLDPQVLSGSVRLWVLLEISWFSRFVPPNGYPMGISHSRADGPSRYRHESHRVRDHQSTGLVKP